MPAPEKIMNVRELFLRIARLPLAEKGRIVAAETLFPSASVNVVTGVEVDADAITLETRKERI